MARHRPRYRLEGLCRQDRQRGQLPETRQRRQRLMHGPLPDQADVLITAPGRSPLAVIERALAFLNNIIVVLSALALVAACAVLIDSVLGRALFQSPNYWQAEAAGFLLVGATFMSSAYVQAER